MSNYLLAKHNGDGIVKNKKIGQPAANIPIMIRKNVQRLYGGQ